MSEARPRCRRLPPSGLQRRAGIELSTINPHLAGIVSSISIVLKVPHRNAGIPRMKEDQKLCRRYRITDP